MNMTELSLLWSRGLRYEGYVNPLMINNCSRNFNSTSSGSYRKLGRLIDITSFSHHWWKQFKWISKQTEHSLPVSPMTLKSACHFSTMFWRGRVTHLLWGKYRDMYVHLTCQRVRFTEMFSLKEELFKDLGNSCFPFLAWRIQPSFEHRLWFVDWKEIKCIEIRCCGKTTCS